jgi:hypothetical protein
MLFMNTFVGRCFLTSLSVAASLLHAQSSAPDPAARQLLTEPHSNRIYVDANCHIHEIAPHTGGMKEHVYTDRGICDVSDERDSTREETDVDDGKQRHRMVHIREHSFMLHNPRTEPVVFVVQQPVTKGWEIDSEPAPNTQAEMIATYLVQAAPSQTVHLHVGERNPPRSPMH